MATVKQTENFIFVNWLRGGAALLVVFFHFYLHVLHDYPKTAIPQDSLSYWFVQGHFNLGKYAVAVFFMVSGFLIPALLRAQGATLRTYAIHRFFRLYPAYWLSVLVFVIVELAFEPAPHLNLRDVLVNLTMLQQFVGVKNVVGAYWTLQIELIFYIICGLLFLSGQLHRRTTMVAGALAGGLLCAVLRYSSGKELPVALFIALALMFLGDGLRALAEGRMAPKRIATLSALIALALLPICLIAYQGKGTSYVLSYWTAMATFLILFAARERLSRIAVANRIGQFLADCSYSVYLLHGTVGMAVGHYLFASTGNAWWAALGMFGSTITLSYATYRLVELPAIRFGKRLGRHVSRARMGWLPE